MILNSTEVLALASASTIATASAAVGALVVLPPGQSEQLPWWERARRTYPSRVAPIYTVFVLTQLIAVLIGSINAILRVPAAPSVLTGVILAAVLGPAAVAMFMSWLGSPRNRPIWYWLAGCASALFFRFGNTLVYVTLAATIYLLPHDLPDTILVLIIGAGAMTFVAWGGGIWVAKALRLGRAALPRAEHASNWAGERVGVRAAAVVELIWPRVRVDGFVFSRYLVVTDAAATLLTDEELLALCTREVTFFQQPLLTGTLRVADSVVIYSLLACTAIGAVLGGHALLIGTLTGFGSVLIMRPFFQRAQLKADALTSLAAADSASALRALERQYELNLQPMVAASARSQDAHLYDRMVAAGIQFSYPRPNPPSKGRVVLSVAAAAGTCLMLSIIFLMGIIMWR